MLQYSAMLDLDLQPALASWAWTRCKRRAAGFRTI